MSDRSALKSYSFIVSGRVQGVYFRQSCAQQARRLGVDGWVKNLTDGRVEGLACGADEALSQLRDWLLRGPPAARVEKVEWAPVEEIPLSGFSVSR